MNLAVHDFDLFAGLRRRNQTGCWNRRGIVAWTPPAAVRARREVAAPLVRDGCLRQYEVGARDAGFFDIFRERLRGRLAHREEALLFLAVHSGSVVLTGEHAVAEMARTLGLRVWAGEAALLDILFPLPSAAAPIGVESPPLAPEMPPPFDRMAVLFSDQFPSRRRVPEGDEPGPAPDRSIRPGRAGSARSRRRPQPQPST